MRIKFRKGEQRKFLIEVLKKIGCPSLRALNQFGFGIPYSTLKNYFSEKRTLPESFFDDLAYLAKVDLTTLHLEKVSESWGQVKGGRK